ncbi:MAG: glutamate--tRNA ligase [Weeksellaceae bacterium]|nr:glutamate--tRNA ligase [Weeksellaceae bacterium]
MTQVRVRFAPSPTGPLHIGGVRTALYNYLFAKRHGGKFVLRIEDTDQSRYVEGAEEYIVESLEWLGIAPDEGVNAGGDYGPYRQSERLHLYEEYAKELVEKGHAYYAFETAEELDNLRDESGKAGETFMYNYLTRSSLRNSLAMDKDEVDAMIAQGAPYVIRFKIPAGESLRMHDVIRGNMVIDSSVLDDKVLYKSDGFPTYHLANIVDDHLMAITHVIRGEEWLPSLPLHVLMYEAFGWNAPSFAHLPLILKPEGKGKLSKRDGDKHGFPVFPLRWEKSEDVYDGYREQGYLPDAMLNMLVLLGWNPGTEQEIFSIDELIQQFDLDKVSKSGARFSAEKAKWFNQQYLQAMSVEDLHGDFAELLREKGIERDAAKDKRIVELMRERAVFGHDLWELSEFFYQRPEKYDEANWKKVWKDKTAEVVQTLMGRLQSADFEAESLQTLLHDVAGENSWGMGMVMMPVRLALVGKLQGPDVPVIMEILGKEEVLIRLENFVKEGDQYSKNQ